MGNGFVFSRKGRSSFRKAGVNDAPWTDPVKYPPPPPNPPILDCDDKYYGDLSSVIPDQWFCPGLFLTLSLSPHQPLRLVFFQVSPFVE